MLKSWVTGMDAEPWIPIDFWFSDEQWLKIFPHLLTIKQASSKDDRDTLSGIMMSSRSADVGRIARKIMARTRISTTAFRARAERRLERFLNLRGGVRSGAKFNAHFERMWVRRSQAEQPKGKQPEDRSARWKAAVDSDGWMTGILEAHRRFVMSALLKIL